MSESGEYALDSDKPLHEYGGLGSATAAASEWLRSEYEEFEEALAAAFESPSPRTRKMDEIVHECRREITESGEVDLEEVNFTDWWPRTQYSDPSPIDEVFGGISLGEYAEQEIKGSRRGRWNLTQQQNGVENNYGFAAIIFDPLEDEVTGRFIKWGASWEDYAEFKHAMNELDQSSFDTQQAVAID